MVTLYTPFHIHLNAVFNRNKFHVFALSFEGNKFLLNRKRFHTHNMYRDRNVIVTSRPFITTLWDGINRSAKFHVLPLIFLMLAQFTTNLPISLPENLMLTS